MKGLGERDGGGGGGRGDSKETFILGIFQFTCITFKLEKHSYIKLTKRYLTRCILVVPHSLAEPYFSYAFQVCRED